jgi:hypothetical protein
MQEMRMVKTVHSWKPNSKRQTGRTKIRWEDDVKEDIQKCQIGRPLSRIEEDGRKWLRRPKLCTRSCRAVLRRSLQSSWLYRASMI